MQSLMNRMPEVVSSIGSSPVALTVAKVTLVLVLTLVVAQVTKRRAASVRHRVLALGLVGAFAIPMVGALAPAWTLAVLPADVRVGATANAAAHVASRAMITHGISADVAMAPEPIGTVSQAAAIAPIERIAPIAAIAPIEPNVSHAPAAFTPTVAVSTDFPNASTTSRFDGAPWLSVALIALWCIGAAIAFIPWIIGVRYRRQLARSATDELSTAWTVSIESLRRANRLSSHVRVLSSNEIDTPMTWGTISPVILVPQYSNWDSLQRRAALLHEIAHVERHDSAVQFLTRLACALHWYNPLVWMVARREQLAREQACDDSVLSSGISASRYAEQLMQFTQFMASEVFTNRARAAIMPMATSSSAATRLRAILDASRSRKSLGAASKSAMTLLALGASAAIAGATPVRAADARLALDVAIAPVVASASSADIRPVATSISDVEPALATTVQRYAEEAAPAPSIAPNTDSNVATAFATAASPNAAAASTAPVADTPALKSLDYRNLIGATIDGGPRPATAVRAPIQEAAQSLCMYNGSGSRSTSISSGSMGSGGKRSIIIKWNSKRCDVDFALRGSFVLNDAGNDITAFPDGGSLTLREDAGSREREARLSASASGIKREYWENGDKKAWDSDAANWFSSALVSLDREVGFLADQRIPSLLKRGGPSLVLEEIGRLTGDGARQTYATKLIKTDVLSPAQIEELVGTVASKIGSDYGKAELLIAVAGLPAANQRTQTLVATAANRIGSDYEHRRTLMALLNRKDLTADAYRTIMQGSETIGSDYEVAELIIAAIKTTVANPDVNSNVSIILPRVSRIGSDYEKRRAMQSMLTWTLNDQAIVQLLDASTSIGSDYEHAELLMAVIKRGVTTANAREALLKSSQKIGSDHERNRVQAAAFKNLRTF